ncbi:MAG: hypothetical protein JWM26_3208 [Betaproteobacteria bacterium]|jgi:hypothetical protein|nr:hypothetical protein [Betaproteobacteria bacterium]
MSIVFEQIDSEIAPERGADAPTPDAASGGAADKPAETADAVRRELALLSERRERLRAD